MMESDYLEENARLLGTIKRLPTLGPFGEKELKTLLKRSKIRKYRPGEIIVREGKIDPWIFFLVYGKVRVEKNEKVLAVIDRQGDTIGEMGIIDRSHRSASAIAESETVCLATDTRHIDQMSGLDRMVFCAILYRIIAETLAERLRVTSDALVQERQRGKWISLEHWRRLLPKRFFPLPP
jgi:CRP-like cAMP-binding protein